MKENYMNAQKSSIILNTGSISAWVDGVIQASNYQSSIYRFLSRQKEVSLHNFANAWDKIASSNTTAIDDRTNQIFMVRCNATYYIDQCISTSVCIIIVRREVVWLEMYRGNGKFDNMWLIKLL